MSFSNAWENMILKHRFNIQSYATSELWAALSSADPLDDASGLSEPTSAKGYYRVKTNNGSGTSWQVSDSSGTTINNSAIITFSTSSNDWGTMTHFALMSGSTAGASVLCHGELTNSKVVVNGDVVRFSASALNICLK